LRGRSGFVAAGFVAGVVDEDVAVFGFVPAGVVEPGAVFGFAPAGAVAVPVPLVPVAGDGVEGGAAGSDVSGVGSGGSGLDSAVAK